MSKTTIPTAGLADSAVTTAKITDGTIATADIADSAVTLAKTTGVGTDLQAVADGSAGSPSIANSGDTNTGIFFPAADKVGITTAGNLHTTFLGDGSQQQIQHGASGGGDGIFIKAPGNSNAASIESIGNEGKGAFLFQIQDQGDDNGDYWSVASAGNPGNNNADDGKILWADFDAGSWDIELKLEASGALSAEGAMNANTTVDYAEFFEWKTELASNDKITETYGMTVVLDGDKVRLAEAGEEAKVIGVVRPTGTSACVGGAHNNKWKNKFSRNVWGEIEYENYTQVNWIKDGQKFAYAKDLLPDDAPKTDEEKAAVNYEERTVYKRDKGSHKKGDLLMRKKLNPDYDPDRVYVGRDKRRKEWAIVGLLGQVPIRDTAIIPTTWTKMKNVGTGIDLYFIK
jgi:hypothetical protein